MAVAMSVWLLSPVLRAQTPETQATIVVFNSNDPQSAGLAEYYRKRRNIAANHVIGLACPVAEEISRKEYDTTIAAPLRKAFIKRKWWIIVPDGNGKKVEATGIRFVALIRGMPLKIRPSPDIPPVTDGLPGGIGAHNEASVDSELATLGLYQAPVSGIVWNPYFGRYASVMDGAVSAAMLLVCRLDGPTPEIVRAMIDDSISTEQGGLWGWACVDTRNIGSGGYAEGDKWLVSAAEDMRSQGIPVLVDHSPETLPEGYPVTDAAVYYGWYASGICGPFAAPPFRFLPGALAVHIYSFSAATLRDPAANWCAPLLVHGAAATLGAVYEPYLSLMPHLDVFQDRLMAGFTLAESAYMAVRVISWMNVVVGDPLYKPYAKWYNLDTSDVSSMSPWQRYRHIILSSGGNVLSAAPALKEASETLNDSMFLESLGAAQSDAGQNEAALKSLDEAVKLATAQPIRFRIDLERINILRTLGRVPDAQKIAVAAYTDAGNVPEQLLLQQVIKQLGPVSPNP